MTTDIASLIVNEGIWLPIAMTAAFATVVAVDVRHRSLAGRRRILAAMNLFAGMTLLIMGLGHLLAVTTKLLQGTLQGSVPLLYLIGAAVVIPAWLILRHTKSLLAGTQAGSTVRLNLLAAGTLVVLGLINIPLAIPALLNAGYSRFDERRAGQVIVALFVLVNLGLFIGGVMFMASGARTFEEFQGLQ